MSGGMSLAQVIAQSLITAGLAAAAAIFAAKMSRRSARDANQLETRRVDVDEWKAILEQKSRDLVEALRLGHEAVARVAVLERREDARDRLVLAHEAWDWRSRMRAEAAGIDLGEPPSLSLPPPPVT